MLVADMKQLLSSCCGVVIPLRETEGEREH